MANEPKYAYFCERVLRNGMRSRIEILPRATAGNYTDWIEMPANFIDEEIIVRTVPDSDLPIGLVEGKGMSITLNIFEIDITATKISTDLADYSSVPALNEALKIRDAYFELINYLNEPEIITDITIQDVVFKNKRLANVFNLYYHKNDIYGPGVTIYDYFYILTNGGDEPVLNSVYTIAGLQYYVAAYKSNGSDYYILLYHVGEITPQEQNVTIQEFTGKEIYFFNWAIEFSGVQKTNIEREEYVGQNRNKLSLELGDTARHCLEQISAINIADILDSTDIEVNGDFLIDLWNSIPVDLLYEKRDWEYLEGFEDMPLILQGEYGPGSVASSSQPRIKVKMLPLDTVYRKVFECSYDYFKEYCFHDTSNERTPKRSFIEEHEAHPFWFHNFFESDKTLRGGSVNRSNALTWESVVSGEVEQYFRSNGNVYVISRTLHPVSNLTIGGLFSDGRYSLGEVYSNMYEFIRDSSESAGVFGYYSFKNNIKLSIDEWNSATIIADDNLLPIGVFPFYSFSYNIADTEGRTIANTTDWDRKHVHTFSPLILSTMDLKVLYGVDVLRSVKISTVGYESEDNKDFVNTEVVNELSRGSTEYNIKDFVWNNVPNAKMDQELIITKILDWRNELVPKEIVNIKENPVFGTPYLNPRKLYYKDDINRFIRVHEAPQLYVYDKPFDVNDTDTLRYYDQYELPFIRLYVNSKIDPSDDFKEILWRFRFADYGDEYGKIKYLRHKLNAAGDGYYDFYVATNATRLTFGPLYNTLFNDADPSEQFTFNYFEDTTYQLNYVMFKNNYKELEPRIKRNQLNNSLQKITANALLTTYSNLNNRINEYSVELNIRAGSSVAMLAKTIYSTQSVGLKLDSQSTFILISQETNLKTCVSKIKTYQVI